MELVWTKTDKSWIGEWGKFRAEVQQPSRPLGFSYWSLRIGDKIGPSGGTISIEDSKRAAEKEIERQSRVWRSIND